MPICLTLVLFLWRTLTDVLTIEFSGPDWEDGLGRVKGRLCDMLKGAVSPWAIDYFL